ncbi:aldehyde dehydrogenase family protein [Lipingzhangella sp. LS1_29]|uniref:Aldehyde dehydrogenase family protein n=1 Tax=Lipingzhangella rawalii TaxID=2055835 RepID=A0ABU2H258_9ACTN|nr:aldehyde dehydrogenase family protein [Lipingzhangella rawalii]MDS1269376.1 aldehyde dehydrogenase family protein [Lipingzhangella rawalii]
MAERSRKQSTSESPDPIAERLAVRRTHKLYLGGAFPRSESNRSYAVTSSTGVHLANAARASRKDVRDAVSSARAAWPGWSGRSAHNRGQILYRVAELLEGRRAQFAEELTQATGLGRTRAGQRVSASIDRWVYYAGWTDKIAQVLGSTNPVSGPFGNVSRPESCGVVGVIAPQQDPLLGLVSVLAPVLAAGNTAVVLASEPAPIPAVSLSEVLATADVPAGVVNILTGHTSELAPPLASHEELDGLDLCGAGTQTADLATAAATTLTRILHPIAGEDFTADPGLSRIRPFMETKTVWQPLGT